MFDLLAAKKKEPQRDPLLSLEGEEPLNPKLSWLGIFLDSLLVLASIAFVVFAGLAMASDGQPLTKDSRAQLLLDITFYGPTIFPILFAAIVGRALKALATWELQNGSTIGHVETLSGSTTLIGAIITQIQLRNINLVAFALVVLWALSPVGGQASLRVLRPGTRVTKTQHQIHTLDPSSASEQANGFLAKTLFASSLITSKLLHNQSQDSWGNLRIPMIEVFDNHQDNAWIKIPTDATNVTFSSLVGIPFAPILPDEPTTFTLNTSYMSLKCPTFRTRSRNTTAPVWTDLTEDPPPLENPNNTWYNSNTIIELGGIGHTVPNGFQLGMSSCLWGCYQWQKTREARRVFWESASPDKFSHIDCTLHSTYVDVKYSCINASCAPNEVRLSPNIPDPDYFHNPNVPTGDPLDPWNARNFTGFDKGGATYTSVFLNAFTSAFDIRSSHEIIPVLGFLLSPNGSVDRPPDVFYDDITSIGRSLFEVRLSQLINTLFIAAIQPSVIAGAMPVTQENETFDVVTLTAETRNTIDIVVCNKTWFAIMLIICVIVLFISLSGAVVRAITLVPDVLGTLSIVTLDNQCEKQLQKASMLDGLERSRLLKDVGIKLGNVKRDSPSGRIAFAAPAYNMEVAELQENVLYE